MRQVLLLLLSLLAFSGCSTAHPLVGTWKTNTAAGDESVLYFKADGTFEALTKGEKLTGKWVYNEETQPELLELEFEEQRKVITIAKISTDQLLLEPREKDAELAKKFTENAQKYQRQP